MALRVSDEKVSEMLQTSICPKTPRDPNMSKEQKQQNKAESDMNYKVDSRQFNAVLKEFGDRAVALFKLNQQFGVMKSTKGATLVVNFVEDGKNYQAELTRKGLKAANAAFQQELLCLKHYFRMSKKKAHAKSSPESLKGTYTPIYAAPALQYFLTYGAGGFGYVDPTDQNSGLLMSEKFLPYASRGYMLRNSTTMLFFIYAHANDLQFKPQILYEGTPNATRVDASWTRSDDVMNAAFGGNIPAAFFRDPQKTKWPVSLAREQNLDTGSNTYDPIMRQNPKHLDRSQSPDGKEKFAFRPDAFKTFFFQNIASANYWSIKNLQDEINRGVVVLQEPYVQLNDPDVRRAMINEHQIIKRTTEAWSEILEPGRKVLREARKKAKEAEKKAAKEAAKGARR